VTVGACNVIDGLNDVTTLTGDNNPNCVLVRGSIVRGMVDLGTGDDCFFVEESTIEGNILSDGGDNCMHLIDSEVADCQFRAGADTIIIEGGCGIADGPDDFSDLRTGNGNDCFYVTSSNNRASSMGILNGQGGDDCLSLFDSYSDFVSGGPGNDMIYAEDASFGTVAGGTDNDVIVANRFVSGLARVPGQVQGGDGDDMVTANGFQGGDGMPTLGGGDGMDTCINNDGNALINPDCEMPIQDTTRKPINCLKRIAIPQSVCVDRM